MSATTISVAGDRPLSCEITPASSPLAGYHVGDAVKMGCRESVLYGIVKDTPTTTTATTTTTTTTTTATHTYASGTISGLSATSVTVNGTTSTLTCAIGATGPSPTAYGLGVGSHVTVVCENGVLTHISTA